MRRQVRPRDEDALDSSGSELDSARERVRSLGLAERLGRFVEDGGMGDADSIGEQARQMQRARGGRADQLLGSCLGRQRDEGPTIDSCRRAALSRL